MGTRSGAIDPGVILYLLSERGMSIDEVTDLLYHRSGLLGVSGMSNRRRRSVRVPDRS
jgi:acetate kinase